MGRHDVFTYKITDGELTHEGDFIGTGYSGVKGSCRNNPDCCNEPDTGPIPVGTWSIGEPFTDIIRGPVVMRLTPSADTETYGRDGFLIHGDNKTGNASTGCIILGPSIREYIAKAVANGDASLTVAP
jgi:hypothetical protein